MEEARNRAERETAADAAAVLTAAALATVPVRANRSASDSVLALLPSSALAAELVRGEALPSTACGPSAGPWLMRSCASMRQAVARSDAVSACSDSATAAMALRWELAEAGCSTQTATLAVGVQETTSATLAMALADG